MSSESDCCSYCGCAPVSKQALFVLCHGVSYAYFTDLVIISLVDAGITQVLDIAVCEHDFHIK